MNGTILEKMIDHKMCVWPFLQILSATFFIIRRTQREIIINVLRSSSKVPAVLVGFQGNLHFVDRFSKNPGISNSMEPRPVKAELFHADGQTHKQMGGHRRDKTDSRYSQMS
jgi:hypothetical protein